MPWARACVEPTLTTDHSHPFNHSIHHFPAFSSCPPQCLCSPRPRPRCRPPRRPLPLPPPPAPSASPNPLRWPPPFLPASPSIILSPSSPPPFPFLHFQNPLPLAFRSIALLLLHRPSMHFITNVILIIRIRWLLSAVHLDNAQRGEIDLDKLGKNK